MATSAKLVVNSAASINQLTLYVNPGEEDFGMLSIEGGKVGGSTQFSGIFNIGAAKQIRDFISEHLVEEKREVTKIETVLVLR